MRKEKDPTVGQPVPEPDPQPTAPVKIIPKNLYLVRRMNPATQAAEEFAVEAHKVLTEGQAVVFISVLYVDQIGPVVETQRILFGVYDVEIVKDYSTKVIH